MSDHVSFNSILLFDIWEIYHRKKGAKHIAEKPRRDVSRFVSLCDSWIEGRCLGKHTCYRLFIGQ